MIKHIKCDIFESGADVICHQVNCLGIMGSGVARQVREKYPIVYEKYKDLCKHFNYGERLLGMIQPVTLDNGQMIVNIFGQHTFGSDGCYTNYEKLQDALNILAMTLSNKTIAFPYKMSCDRGGGDWNIVYKMIEDTFDKNTEVLICEYDGG